MINLNDSEKEENKHKTNIERTLNKTPAEGVEQTERWHRMEQPN